MAICATGKRMIRIRIVITASTRRPYGRRCCAHTPTSRVRPPACMPTPTRALAPVERAVLAAHTAFTVGGAGREQRGVGG